VTGGTEVAFVVRQLQREGKLDYVFSGSTPRRSRLALVPNA
jgi:hypothetical protein